MTVFGCKGNEERKKEKNVEKHHQAQQGIGRNAAAPATVATAVAVKHKPMVWICIIVITQHP